MKKNPTESKRLSMTGTKKKREALSQEAVLDIISNLDKLEEQERVLLALFIFTGMRRGEVLGLCWEDIDWEKKLIHVERAVTFHNNQPIIGETKSEAGVRSIPLDVRLEEILLPLKQDFGLLIPDRTAPMTERKFTRTWERIGKKISLYNATPHIFRHTYITFVASTGVDVKTIQAIAGHSDVKMTMDKYCHKREEKVIEAGRLIRSAFIAS